MPQPAWRARCGPGHGGPGPRGSAVDGTGAVGPELPASPAVHRRESRRWLVPSDHGVVSAKQSRAALGPRPASAGPAQGRGRPRAGALGGTHGPDPGQPEPLRGTPAHGACRGLRRAPLRPRRLGPGRHPPIGPDVTCSTDNDNAPMGLPSLCDTASRCSIDHRPSTVGHRIRVYGGLGSSRRRGKTGARSDRFHRAGVEPARDDLPRSCTSHTETCQLTEETT